MKYLLWIGMVALAWILVDDRIEKAHVDGFRLGMHYALKSNPPSEELEMTCAGMWMGQQNQKYFQKTK